jgi:hypothetical protein
MIEIEFYAAGLRQGDAVLRLGNALEPYPHVRYKVDTNHDVVYFEIRDPDSITLQELDRIFLEIGLTPRIVGEMPEGLKPGRKTQRLT